MAGRRAGLDGARSGLWWEVVRVLADLRPRWFIGENVPGLLSSVCTPECDGGCMAVHGGAMGAVLGSLAELGYGISYRILDAQHFGVPQRRQRVFIVGHLGEPWAAPAQVLLEPESGAGDSAASGETWQGDSDGTAASIGGTGRRPAHRREVVAALTSNGVGTCGADDNQTQAGHVVAGGHDTMPSVATETIVRRLTELECERLQGFPDNWTDGQSGSVRYRQLGNSVAVPVVEWIARRLVAVDTEHRQADG